MAEPHTPPPSSPSRPSLSPRSSKRPAPVLARWQFENQASTSDTVQHQPRKVGRLSIPSPLPSRSNPSSPLASPTTQTNMAAAAAQPPPPPPTSSSLVSDASDLADHIQNLSLNDIPAAAAKEEVPGQTTDVSTQISNIADAIASVRSIVFEVEEKRHAGAAITDLEMTIIQMDTKLESISTSIQTLEAQVQNQDTTSSSSTLADDDDDDDDFAIPGVQPPSAAAKSSPSSRFQDLNRDWTALQQETETLKRELTDDKYVAHFNTASKQAESLMDSLAKALTICSKFVSDFHSNGGRVPLSDDEDNDDERDNAKQLERLHSVLKGFHTKRSYYTPACEQTFAAFDRSLKERSTAHGTLLRNFTELKKRWKQMKEHSARMDRELRKIESRLTNTSTTEAQSPQPTLPIKSSMRSVSGAATVPRPPSTSPPLPIKSTRRVISTSQQPNTAATSRNGNGMSSSPSTGSLLPPRTASAAAASSSRHNRSISIQPTSSGASTSRTRPPSTSALSRSLGPSSYDSPSKRNSSNLTPSKPPSAYRPHRFGSGNLGSPSDRETALQARSKTPQPPGSTSMLARNFRFGSEPPEVPRIPSAYRPQPPKQGRGDGEEDSIEYMDPAADLSLDEPAPHSRPGSAMSTNAQPQFPLHYRPPSALGSHIDDDGPSIAGTPRSAKRQSRIPTYTFPNNSAPGNADNRPSSSLSQTSTTRFMGHQRGASRSTMQTPEPMIAARVKRLSMYAKPSTGGNVPSTSKRASAAYPSSTPSAVGSRPPSASYRWSTAGGGRTTPLSASALAKVPHAGPVSLPGGNGDHFGGATSSYAQSNASGSVANFRASRQQALRSLNASTPTHYSSSIRDGANTPTFSEGGMSNFSGIASSRLYRPNPNDILDVSISNITNALGIPLTRIDDPLPRGMKTETGPGKEIRGRYSFGGTGTVMMCKLLELHRPASIYGAGAGGMAQGGKQRKVLVKVPGKGFLDLELWLLSAFETEGGSQMN